MVVEVLMTMKVIIIIIIIIIVLLVKLSKEPTLTNIAMPNSHSRH